jgi:2-oxo-4-hydroxy-4-carboxy-5-ureidoimidazoline decarboxylase
MAGTQISIDDVNLMPHADFVGAFGDVAEHSPWVAEVAAHARPVCRPPGDDRRLPGRHFRGSAGETAGAGARASRSCRAGRDRRRVDAGVAEGAGRRRTGPPDPEEFARFSALNDAYRERSASPSFSPSRAPTSTAILVRSRRGSTTIRKRNWRRPSDRSATSSRSGSRIVSPDERFRRHALGQRAQAMIDALAGSLPSRAG